MLRPSGPFLRGFRAGLRDRRPDPATAVRAGAAVGVALGLAACLFLLVR